MISREWRNLGELGEIDGGRDGSAELDAMLDELHGSFASLDQEQQRYADLVI